MKRFFALLLSVILIALPVLACCESSTPIDEKVRFLEANADRSLFKDGQLMVYLHAPIIQRSTVDDLDADTISALTAVVYYELTIDILTKETFKQYFSKGTPQILVSEKSYVGKDDQLLSIYFETDIYGIYALYDISSQVMAYLFLNQGVAELAEKELFKTQLNPISRMILKYWKPRLLHLRRPIK